MRKRAGRWFEYSITLLRIRCGTGTEDRVEEAVFSIWLKNGRSWVLSGPSWALSGPSWAPLGAPPRTVFFDLAKNCLS